MSHALGSKLQLEPGSWAEAVYEVAIGMIVGTCHVPNLVASWWRDGKTTVSGKKLLNGTTTTSTDDGEPNELKVVAVGYGRTGTYSLTLALEELGYPTLHTQHLYEHPEIISMWTNTIFLPSIQSGVTSLGTPDFDLIAQKFQATADLPMALYYEQVLEKYPNCKFILTERDSPETWFRSWNTLTLSITEATNLGGFVFVNVRRYAQYLRWIFSIVNQNDAYLTVPTPLPPQDPVKAMESYTRHNQKVRATIPSEQLLVYNVREGWAPLCDFLTITDCPTTAFPKTNSARSVKVQAVSGLLINLMVVLFVVFYAFAAIFQRCTGMTVLQWMSAGGKSSKQQQQQQQQRRQRKTTMRTKQKEL